MTEFCLNFLFYLLFIEFFCLLFSKNLTAYEKLSSAKDYKSFAEREEATAKKKRIEESLRESHKW